MTVEQAHKKANEVNKENIDLELQLSFKKIEDASNKGEYSIKISKSVCGVGTQSALEERGFRVFDFKTDDFVTIYWERIYNHFKQ